MKSVKPQRKAHHTHTKRFSPLFACEDGISALVSAIVMLLLIITVGFSIASSGLLEGFISEAQRQSQEAYFAAETGEKDAIMKIARNKNFSSAGYFIPSFPSDCALNGASPCALVVAEKDAASACSQGISSGQHCIIVTGTYDNKTRKIEIILNVNAINGKISQASWKEI